MKRPNYLRAHPVDIALLDINMPGIDGITPAFQIKQISPKTSILFLTAYKFVFLGQHDGGAPDPEHVESKASFFFGHSLDMTG